MNVVNFILGIVIAVVGVIMTVTPDSLLKVIIILLGAGSLVFGIYDIVKVRIMSPDRKYRISVIVRGLLSIVIGIIAVVSPLTAGEAIATVIKVMLYILAVFLIICAAEDLFIILELRKKNVDRKGAAGKCIATLAVGILLFFLPVESLMKLILRIIGIILILGGAGFSFATWRKRVTVVQPEDVRDVASTDSVEDAIVVDVEDTSAQADDAE